MNKYKIICISIIFINFIFLCKECNSLCLDLRNRIHWNRNFHFKNKETPIKIDVSSRASHIIISYIVKILLQERLGYKDVQLNYYSEDSTDILLKRLSCVDTSCSNGNPVSHINAELWIIPGYSFSSTYGKQLIDCGPLGPTTHKGLFVDADLANKVFATDMKIIDHWRLLDNNCQFEDSEFCIPESQSNFISKSDKINNVIYPKLNIPIKETKGNSSRSTVVTQQHTNTLFWNWYPNVDTVQGNFTRVLFPDCWDSSSNATCDLEVSQLTKVVWSYIKDHAEKAYFLINALRFSHEEYVALLKVVNMSAVDLNEEYYDVACKWLRNNVQKWSAWTPGWNVADKVYLPILVSDYEIWKADDTIITSIYGIKILNDHVFNDTHYEIIPEIHKLVCDEDIILSQYLSLIEKHGPKIIGFIVCLCPRTFNSLIKISNLQQRIILSSSIESTYRKNFTEYNYFFSTQPNMHHYNLVLIKMFHSLNWSRVVILKKDDNLFDEKSLPRYNITVLATNTTPENQLNYYKIYEFLEVAKLEHKASVFIVDYLKHGTQLIMCAAGNLGMNLENGYVFILNPLIDPFWSLNLTSKHCPLNKIISKEYFIIKHDTFSEHSDNYIRNNNTKFNTLSRMTHDAILYLGNSFHELIMEEPSANHLLQSIQISKKFVHHLANQFEQMIGPKANYKRRAFNENHERNGIWKIQRVAFSHSFLMSLSIFKWNISRGFEAVSNLPKLEKLFVPKNFMIPKDRNSESDCPVERLRHLFGWSCTATQIFINIFCIASGIAILIGVLLWCYRKQAVIMEDRYKKPFDDLCAELADIDIRSSDVVISLQVGKGAFGIVYGGEAKRNNRWESVAIKLIKKEADYQGKIDFLTEAKLMRNLEHPNIVKLIGICLNPLKPAIYLVMELVVNGDLEDYLLTNRITANKDPNNKLVCPSLLTRFVKDIASGTEYLHKNSLLHRDLACRNCFLSEEYVVKIGDFGLTRNIDDSQINQYYRTARHFVLPARWMPPEAVQFGYFSIQSDIWSLGVVVFEVATFCSRPYFDVTDEEVPELVKRNTMPLVNYLPESAKDSDVFRLIERCCQYKREERPESMSEIVKYLEDNKECIRPYITSNPPQPTSMGVWNLMNPYDNHQRPSAMSGGGLNRFKSTSRSRTSVGNWGVFSDSYNNFNSILQSESDYDKGAFQSNPDQVPFIPNEAEFITVDHNTNRIGSKKRLKSSKKVSSNLNSSKSRSTDFMTNKIEDDQEQSYVSCPDPGNVHCLGDFDAQDFPANDCNKCFNRSASGDEKSITSGRRPKTFRNGKILYNGSSRNHKVKAHKYSMSGKSKSRLNSSQVFGNRRLSDMNGMRPELVQPLLYERAANVSIQPKKGRNFKNCMDDEKL